MVFVCWVWVGVRFVWQLHAFRLRDCQFGGFEPGFVWFGEGLGLRNLTELHQRVEPALIDAVEAGLVAIE